MQGGLELRFFHLKLEENVVLLAFGHTAGRNLADQAVCFLETRGKGGSYPLRLVGPECLERFFDKAGGTFQALAQKSRLTLRRQLGNAGERDVDAVEKRLFLVASNLFLIAGLFAISTFSFAVLSTMVLALPSDLYPSGSVASVSGLSGTGAGIGTVLSTFLIGRISDPYSFGPILIGASLIPLVAVTLVFLLVRKRGPARLL